MPQYRDSIETSVVGIWAAYDREAAWARFWMIVGAVLVFYALVKAESAGSLRVWFLALFGAVAATHFVLTHDWDAYLTKIEALARLGRALQPPLPPLPGPHPNPNVAGATVAMLLPFEVGWIPTVAGIGLRAVAYRLIMELDGIAVIERGARIRFADHVRLGRGV